MNKKLRYDDAVSDMNALSFVCKRFSQNRIEMSEDLQEKLYDTTKNILQHYPKKEKIAPETYRTLLKYNEQLIPLSKKHPTKFEEKIISKGESLLPARKRQTHQPVMYEQ